MRELSKARIIIFGLGGVGSWCAEGLVRSGALRLTLVDSDLISPTNVNRQVMATALTVGRPKAEALKERLLEINPEAQIVDIQRVYSSETAESFALGSYDYIIDALDSLKDKIDLIMRSSASGARFFSSMGAALKLNPLGVKVAEFWEVRGCPLAAMLRKRMRQRGLLPEGKFLCVYGDESLPNLGAPDFEGQGPQPRSGSTSKAVVNGSAAFVTAIFGFTLCGLVVNDICGKKKLSLR